MEVDLTTEEIRNLLNVAKTGLDTSEDGLKSVIAKLEEAEEALDDHIKAKMISDYNYF
jgi:hypothetical protein